VSYLRPYKINVLVLMSDRRRALSSTFTQIFLGALLNKQAAHLKMFEEKIED
jgi:hypothetical protein